MSEESVPQQGGATSAGGADGRPKGLLQQMEELMAALNADLSALDAEFQSSGGSGRGAATGVVKSGD
ncbi:hypothetical protein ACFVP3_28640 [Streptomyces sp. NPDC057806]|uniref:hypothetical protein n=1 Tax=unclassified Streptomyces TaxID=2593676 RepID=UPI00201FDF75|nr:hypothetical protein [Streptomyces sp. YS415]MCL7424538.1 hypothetical protein [Streptomyces sp. YS415]